MSGLEPYNELEGDPTEKEYPLKCKTKFFDKAFTEEIGGKKNSYVSKMVFLIPIAGKRQSFLSAWLPDVVGEHYELTGYIRPPYDTPVRLAIFRGPDERCDTHYMTIMSTGVAQLLRTRPEGTEIDIDIKPATLEGEADNAKDADGDYDLIDGHTELKR